jgi:hypothetical protein
VGEAAVVTVEAAVAEVWAPVEESEMVPVTVVEEAEPWSSADMAQTRHIVYRHHWWRSRRR